MQTLVIEHKTTSEDCGLGSVYWAVLTMDSQVSKYLVGGRSLGHDVAGCLYDVLRKPAILPLLATPEADRKYTKATKTEAPRLYANQRDRDETVEEYRARCLAVIAEAPEKHYQRGVVVRLESEERDAAFDTWQTADQIRLSQNAGRWPRNVDSCRTYNRLCDFFPICSGTTSEDDPRFEAVAPHSELVDGNAHLPMLTTSSSRCYRQCPRKYALRYTKGLRARAAAPTLAFGVKVHKGLEAWLLSRDIDAALAAMRDAAAPYGFDDAKADAMLLGYDARWRDDPLEVLAVEAQFVAPLTNPETGAASRTFCLAGKLDGIVKRND